NAGISPQAAGHIRYAGGWQWANEEHIDSHGENARGKGIFEHVSGQARVLAEHDLAFAVVRILPGHILEDVRGGAPKPERGFSGDRFDISSATHPIGVEDFLRNVHKSSLRAWRSARAPEHAPTLHTAT